MKKTILTITCCFAAAFLFAKPAKRGPIVVTQADGTEYVVYQHGDEHFHWTTNEKGEWIQQDEKGQWQQVAALTKEQITERRAASRYAQAANMRQRKPSATQAGSPTNIAERGLVILVNFADLEFQASQAEMDSMHNGLNYTRDYSYTYRGTTYNIHAEGSARRYFQDASFGQYDPKFDVVGPVTVSQKYSYYGGNGRSGEGDDLHPWEMVYEACNLVKAQYDLDFSAYDNDNDGVMDYVYVIYAGYGEADGGGANTIWPHSYWLTEAGYNLVIDGVQVDTYACGNELSYLSKQHDGIGTFVHEFSHVLGLPDFYATNGSSHRTLGDWDVMDYGPYNNDGNNPPTYSGYERFFFGWATPRVLTDTAIVYLNDLLTTNEVLLISETDKHNLIGNNPNPAKFYLLENRQPNMWDQFLAGHGMMLTKINYSYNKWAYNTTNNTETDLGVDIIEAKTNSSSTINRATDLYPAGATQYTGITKHPIYDIQESDDGVISFKFLSPNANADNTGTNMVQEDTGESGNPIVAIYTIAGTQVPVGTVLPSGLYIVRRAQTTEKIIVK